jgi:hypothetical protein
MEIPDDVKPGPVVEISRVDDERVSLPVATRVPLPESHIVSETRSPIQADDAIGVGPLVENHNVSRRLKNLLSTRT